MARIIYILKIDNDNGGQYFHAIQPDQLHAFEKKSAAEHTKQVFDIMHKSLYPQDWENIPCKIIELTVVQ
jgi:hypothetical protein